MVDLIVIIPHGIDAEIEIYHCDIENKTPIECLKEMWRKDLDSFDKRYLNLCQTKFYEENEIAYIKFIDGTYYRYELSFASSLKNYLK